jgi:two-component system sensor histidine kinase BaeS
MRRLAHSLSLLLVGMTLLTVVAMGALVAWNLKRGFNDYLAAREIDRLEQFVEVLVAGLATGPGGPPPDWPRELSLALREFGRLDRPGAEPGGAAGPAPLGEPALAQGPGMNPRPLPGGADGFGARMSLALPDGRHVAGRPLAPGAAFFQVPVISDGEQVALARLRKLADAPDAVDSRFVARQYAGIGIAAGVLLLLAGLVGHFAARRWVSPLLALQRSTTDIANGRRHEPLDETRRDEIGDLMRSVNQMSASLHRLETSRRRWMAEISHELRTPLAVLRGEIDALADGVRPLKASAMVSLQEEVLRLSRLVDDLHLLAMSDLGAMPTRLAEVRPAQLLDESWRRMRTAAEKAGHRLTLDCAPEIDSMVALWDPQRIGQLLDNLLGNSVRHTHAPGRIVLRASTAGSGLQIEVEDTAPGVAPNELAQIFEPLYRVDRARSGEGSGLGLAIARAIVSAHGGRIQAFPSPGGGLLMQVALPLQPVSERT